MLKRTLCILISVLLLCSCGAQSAPVGGTLSSEDVKDETPLVSGDVTEQPPETRPEITEPTFVIPEFSESKIEAIETDMQYCLEMYQAEDGELSGFSAIADFREGYIGNGYVSGVSLEGSNLRITVDAVSNQHYNITLCAATNQPMTGNLYIDNIAVGRFSLAGSVGFEAVKFENIYLAKGEHIISFGKLSAEADIDYIILEDSRSVADFTYETVGALSNSKASEEARKLYSYLCASFGNVTLTAQQCAQGTNDEIYEILRYTGKYPAIRFGEMMNYGVGIDSGDIEYAINYAENGGIVGYVWHWVKGGSIYADKSDFNLSDAVNAHDIARLNESKLNELYEGGGVSDESLSLLEDIDKIAEQFLRLKELDIPVLFRPLPEASGGWYWWGEDKDAYLWLYKLIYHRLTDYWHLDNIIWVWNGQSKDWYVGDEWCDIIALDIYDFSKETWTTSSRVNLLHSSREISSAKPIVISECNVLPNPINMANDNALWGYACVWSGEYVSEDGAFGGDMTETEWVMFYNSSATITREEIAY